MRLIEFRASNFQKLKAVAIRPDGHLVPITGANSAGKTSILRGIWTLLKGKAAAPPRLIRDGEEECRLFGDLGEVKVTRTFRQQDGGDVTMNLRITRADGSSVTTKQQAFLDGLLGDISFDPLAFARSTPKVQYDTLKALVPGIDFDRIALERRKLYEDRTIANRQADEARTLADRIELPPGPCPRPVDATALLTELEGVGKFNADIEVQKDRRENAARAAEAFLQTEKEKREEAERLKLRVAELLRSADQDRAQASEISAALTSAEDLPEPKDSTVIRQRLAEADKIKGVRGLYENRRRHEDQAEEYETKAAGLTKDIEALDTKKAEAIAAAKMPIDGLSLGEEIVLLNGQPLEQAGTAEKIRLGVAINMAMKPDLRLITIDHGSELDSASLKMIEQLATEHDFDVWFAAVDESGEQGFVIVDGSLSGEAA